MSLRGCHCGKGKATEIMSIGGGWQEKWQVYSSGWCNHHITLWNVCNDNLHGDEIVFMPGQLQAIDLREVETLHIYPCLLCGHTWWWTFRRTLPNQAYFTTAQIEWGLHCHVVLGISYIIFAFSGIAVNSSTTEECSTGLFYPCIYAKVAIFHVDHRFITVY